ncbi:MAG: Holliday junction resolvase RuvX [Deltaproteobacteria bacterium]|nr:Holliday junction resolvase RuvX [Deltaproteobacteria bacterium]MBW2050666.1 Holliday junction resolvase RuvX [Deltaproteobacteria bacterium]MBW2139584.1 Holliday junction resolvase RuvX [Deltaproteobacteria bacterium]MBW2322941.1 Holliday junction resolvase RuvX [Deltaproteobacteria bacterium]
MKIMGLDPGSKRVGVALSDDLGMTASGLTTLTWGKKEELLTAIQDLITKYKVQKVVVGLPRRMNGSLGPEAEAALSLAEALRIRDDLVVLTWDERFSTAAAERVLLEADLSRKKRKKVRDKVAAAYILQGYLDSLNISF